MAKAWAKAFYNSRAWKNARREALRQNYYTCVDCDSRAEEVHHEIELTPENINDPNIALNPKLLTPLCHNCHTKRTKGCTGAVDDGYYFDDEGQVKKR